MKIFIIATRSEKHSPEEFAPLLEPEAKMALQFMAQDFFREIYSRTDGKGAVIVVEADSEAAVRDKLVELPLVQRGMLDLELYPVGPYRGIVAAAEA